MNLRSIITARHIQNAPFWQIVWEWEDAIASYLRLPLVKQQPYLFGNKDTKLDRLLFRPSAFSYSEFLLGQSDLPALRFHINPPWVHGYHTRSNVVPIVIDCWRNELHRIPVMFRRQKAIFVCNLEAVNILKASEPLLPIHYLPVSLTESDIPNEIPQKDIDILSYGRTHPDLVQWGHQFAAEHPEVRFCWIGTHEGRPVLYEKGQKTEMGSSRQALMNVLARSRIVLQSSPGIHAQEFERTGGFSPVTPRFFEAAAKCCHMVGIYPENDEFRRLRIADICQRVTTYSEFHDEVKHLLITRFGTNELMRNQAFLRVNTTERRAEDIIRVLQLS